MKNCLFIFIAGFALLSFGCNKTPISVEFSKFCELQNDGNYIETTGYFDNVSDLNCSGKQGGNMTCNLMFKKDVNAEIDINKLIKNEENPTEVFSTYKNFKKEDMEFIGNDNSIITLKDKVKITGKTRVMSSTNIDKKPYINCSITVDKIEKQ
jgi:hypothetical protein